MQSVVNLSGTVGVEYAQRGTTHEYVPIQIVRNFWGNRKM